jgi:hypothetical protein
LTSRREWLLPIFKDAGEKKPRNKNSQVWQQDNHPVKISLIELLSLLYS